MRACLKNIEQMFTPGLAHCQRTILSLPTFFPNLSMTCGLASDREEARAVAWWSGKDESLVIMTESTSLSTCTVHVCIATRQTEDAQDSLTLQVVVSCGARPTHCLGSAGREKGFYLLRVAVLWIWGMSIRPPTSTHEMPQPLTNIMTMQIVLSLF